MSLGHKGNILSICMKGEVLACGLPAAGNCGNKMTICAQQASTYGDGDRRSEMEMDKEKH